MHGHVDAIAHVCAAAPAAFADPIVHVAADLQLPSFDGVVLVGLSAGKSEHAQVKLLLLFGANGIDSFTARDDHVWQSGKTPNGLFSSGSDGVLGNSSKVFDPGPPASRSLL